MFWSEHRKVFWHKLTLISLQNIDVVCMPKPGDFHYNNHHVKCFVTGWGRRTESNMPLNSTFFVSQKQSRDTLIHFIFSIWAFSGFERDWCPLMEPRQLQWGSTSTIWASLFTALYNSLCWIRGQGCVRRKWKQYIHIRLLNFRQRYTVQ